MLPAVRLSLKPRKTAQAQQSAAGRTLMKKGAAVRTVTTPFPAHEHSPWRPRTRPAQEGFFLLLPHFFADLQHIPERLQHSFTALSCHCSFSQELEGIQTAKV